MASVGVCFASGSLCMAGRVGQAILGGLALARWQARRETYDLAARREIAAKENLAPEQIMITAGSTEILGLTGFVYGVAGGELISCFPTFDFMLRYSQTVGATWVQVLSKSNTTIWRP